MVGKSIASQRKAWNDAMRAAGAVVAVGPTSFSSGSTTHPATDSNPMHSSKDSMKKRSRRDLAKKSSVVNLTGDPEEEYQVMIALRLDRLERGGQVCHVLQEDDENDNAELWNCIDHSKNRKQKDDDEYDELEEFEKSNQPRKKANKTNKKENIDRMIPLKKGAKSKAKSSTGGGKIPSWMAPRTLASILIQESTRDHRNGVLQQYRNAEATYHPTTNSSLTNASSPPICKYPPRKFCPVTGLFGIYTDPKSKIPYATLSALEQIRERSPPWMTNLSTGGGASGTTTYYDTMKSFLT